MALIVSGLMPWGAVTSILGGLRTGATGVACAALALAAARACDSARSRARWWPVQICATTRTATNRSVRTLLLRTWRCQFRMSLACIVITFEGGSMVFLSASELPGPLCGPFATRGRPHTDWVLTTDVNFPSASISRAFAGLLEVFCTFVDSGGCCSRRGPLRQRAFPAARPTSLQVGNTLLRKLTEQ